MAVFITSYNSPRIMPEITTVYMFNRMSSFAYADNWSIAEPATNKPDDFNFLFLQVEARPQQAAMSQPRSLKHD